MSDQHHHPKHGESSAGLAADFIAVRDNPLQDIDALRDVLLRVSRLAEEVPEIAELDLNPLIVLERGAGARVVDALIVRPGLQGSNLSASR